MDHFDPRAGITESPDNDGPRRRRAGRLGTESLFCQFGQVLDLSSGGVRIQCRRPPAGEIELMLYSGHEGLKVKARVTWKKRVGLLKHEVGLQFIDLDPEMARTLTTLATTGRMRRAI